jgi:hypothetical protein
MEVSMNRHKWSSTILVLSLVLVLLPTGAWANSSATIRFVPSITAAEVGDTINVDIETDDVSELYAIEVHVAFDVARLQVLDDNPTEAGIQILPGSLFPKSDPSYVVLNQADNTAGTIDFAITLLAPEAPLSGSGTLATIRMAARMAGTAQMSWAFTQMADGDGQTIAHTATDVQIEIAEPDSEPEPVPGKNCVDQIANGGFEATSHWYMPATPHVANYTTADKHSGSRSMRLGIEPGDPDVYSYSPAYYKLSVPANATSVTLTFWARRFTQDPPKAPPDPTTDLYNPGEIIEGTYDWNAKSRRARNDWQELLILQQDCFNWLATLMRTLSNDGVWAQHNYDLSVFAGQDILLYFNVINNGDGERTWMYVDDVQVQACYDDGPCVELVRNRSFEWTAYWAHPNTPRPANYTTAAAHSGSRSMRLGIVPPTADTYSHSSAYQAIQIPAGAPSPSLSFWYKAHSQEPPRSDWKNYDWSSYDPSQVINDGKTTDKCCGEVDWQEMLLLDENYRIVSGGVVLRQVRNDGLWKQVTYDLSPYKGMTIVLYFNVINDGDGQRTWMYVDDVSINLCGYQVRIDPASRQVALGAAFTMDVRAENIANLYGFDATVRFNPAILEIVDANASKPGIQANLGDWLPTSTHVVTNTADNTSGTLHVVASLVAPAPALSGSGDLISIPFRAKATGSTSVYLSALKLVDASAAVIPAEASGGQVTVTTGQATLAGKVLLEGRANHSGTEVRLGSQTTTSTADGSYSMLTAAGTYTLTFSHAAYLSQSVVVTGVAGTTTTVPEVTLLGGDVNGDATIDILDLVAIGAQFGSHSPDPATADVNGDGVVDIIDIVLVAKNFQ